MTATCPPSLRSELLSHVGISQCHVIHAPTDRPEIQYNVNLFETLDEARTKLVDVVKKRLEELKADTSFRGLVYCRSKADVDLLATLIGCKPFHADRPEEERRVSFNDWVAGKAKFMVYTLFFKVGLKTRIFNCLREAFPIVGDIPGITSRPI